MLKTLSKLATGKNILILLALFLLANFGIVPLVYPKFQTLDMLNGYTPTQAYGLISSYGEQGRQAYAIIEVTLDLIYPLVTGILFSLLTLYSLQHGFPNQKWTRWLAFLPFTVMTFDYLENTSILILLLEYPRQLSGLTRIASFFLPPPNISSPPCNYYL
jgi:hypothetical protein